MEEKVMIKCPECGQLSDSIKCYTLMENRVFIGVYTWWRNARYTCCPKCMLKHIFKSTFSWNMITGNFLWLFLDVPYNLLHLIGNNTKGHSGEVKAIIKQHAENQNAAKVEE